MNVVKETVNISTSRERANSTTKQKKHLYDERRVKVMIIVVCG